MIEIEGARLPSFRELVEGGRVPGFKQYRKIASTFAFKMREPFLVHTLEGPMEGKAGDYIACGIEGEMYPVAADIFERTYEAVD